MEKKQYEKLILIRQVQAAGRDLLKRNHGVDISFVGYGRQEKKAVADIIRKVEETK